MRRSIPWGDHVLKGQRQRTVAQKMTHKQKQKYGTR